MKIGKDVLLFTAVLITMHTRNKSGFNFCQHRVTDDIGGRKIKNAERSIWLLNTFVVKRVRNCALFQLD